MKTQKKKISIISIALVFVLTLTSDQLPFPMPNPNKNSPNKPLTIELNAARITHIVDSTLVKSTMDL